MRLRRLLPDELDAAQRSLYDELTSGDRSQVPSLQTDVQMTDADGRLQGPFNALLFHPRIGDALQELSRCLRFEGVLSPRAREIVILVVAASEHSDFEWAAHAAIARSLGIPEALIEVFAEGEVPHLDDPQEEAAATLARSLVTSGDADDETFTLARSALGERGIFEVSTTVGVYQLLAQQMRLFRVDSPPGPW
jgi:4-carboxymuconolactone decarboxylase